MPGPACCLLAAFISSATLVEAAAGVEGEVAAGRAPVSAQLTDKEENSVTFTLVPGAALRFRSKANTLSLSYAPRIFYRVPNALEVTRPLILHQVGLDDVLSVSRNMAWTSSAGLSVGEVDYTASGLVFEQGSSGVRASVVDIVRSDAETGFKLDVTRRFRWELKLSGQYTTPLDEDTNPPVTSQTPAAELGVVSGTVPESAQFSTRSSLSYAINPTDRLAANGEVTYQWFPDTGRFLLLSPDISWDSKLNRRTSIGASVGFAYVVTLEAQAGSSDSDAFGGTGSFKLDTVMYKARDVTVTSGFGASLDWYFDPIAGTSQPRAGATANTTIAIGRDWVISPSASFYTVVRDASTRVGDDTTTAAGQATTQQLLTDSTQLRGEIPFSYRISDLVSINFGARGSMRGGSLTEDNFRLDQRVEIWGFMGLTVRYSSGNDTGAWLAL